VVDEIKTYVAAFIRCPAAQVYYWLKHKGCLGADVNHLIRKCFTVDPQQKVTKSKYIKEKGFAGMKDSNENDLSMRQTTQGYLTCPLAYQKRNNAKECPKPITMNQHNVQRSQGRINGSLQLLI
jgi:hypothetical protein